MRFLSSVSALMLLGLPAPNADLSAQPASQAAIPDTAAGRQLAGYLAAINTMVPERLDAFLEAEFPNPPFPRGPSGDFQRLIGGLELVRIESTSDTEIVALVRERGWDGYFDRLRMGIDPQSGKITQLFLQPTQAPTDWPPIPRTSEDQALAALKAKLDDAASTGGPLEFAGAVMVSRNGMPVFEYVSGQADRDKGIANTLDTKFRIGSMNKMFTAVAVLQLVEAGRVDLDAPIGTYLTDYPNQDIALRVTVRNLLTHTGGTGDIFGPQFVEHRAELCDTSDYLALYGPRNAAFAPGERYAYSNYGFVLLAAIVEAVSGQTYYDYVDEHIYRPAGMTASGSLPESVAVPGRSIGYMQPGPGGQGGQLIPNTETLPCRGSGAGGGYSTVGDLVRFAEALRAGKLLGPELVQTATTRQVPAGLTSPANYGFGFGTGDVNGTPMFGHNGGAPGMSAELMVFPELGYEVAVVSNTSTQLVTRFARFVGERLPAQE